jgi:hypothetical protein
MPIVCLVVSAKNTHVCPLSARLQRIVKGTYVARKDVASHACQIMIVQVVENAIRLVIVSFVSPMLIAQQVNLVRK